MSKVTQQPFDPGSAAWNAILPVSKKYPRLEKQINADWLVVGAGFAGLSAAKRLHELHPKDKIVLLEARRIAEGPTGRNSGFMIDLPHNLNAQDYVGELTSDVMQTQMNRHAINFAEAVSKEYQFSPEAFVKSGKINAAATDKGTQHNHDYAHHLEGLNESCELLDEKQMRAICGSDYYQSGLYTAGTAMIQPALYVREFAEEMAKSGGVQNKGVHIYEKSAVINYIKQGNDWLFTTSKGGVSAPKVILAVNGHIESFSHFKRRLVHIYLYASMTRVFSDEEVKSLGGEIIWGFTPADAMGTTVRKIVSKGGHRIVVRNQITYNPSRTVNADQASRFLHKHQQSFAARFPMLKDVNMEYTWGGALCMSRNNVPAFGEIDAGLYSACCQNGLGTVQGTLAGLLAAEQASGVDSGFLKQTAALPKPSRLPPEPIAAIGANIVTKWGEFKAGKEL